MHSSVERLGVALAPRTPEVEALVARRVVEFAAEVGDVDLVDEVAEDVETPDEVTLLDLAARAGIT